MLLQLHQTFTPNWSEKLLFPQGLPNLRANGIFYLPNYTLNLKNKTA